MGRPTEEILRCIPHRRPFLFVDEVVDRREKGISTLYRITGEEFFFQGHFPDNPIVPRIILMEAAFQSGAVCINDYVLGEELAVVSRVRDVHFEGLARPGDLLEIDISLEKKLAHAFYMLGKMYIQGKQVMELHFVGTLVKKVEN